jgi:hypothetical protein
MVSIKTIDFPDATHAGHHRGMDTNLYALETMAVERLTQARRHAQHLAVLALARARRRPLRARLGGALVALGEWLRRGPVLAPEYP